MRTILRTALALAGSAALVLPMVAQAGSPSRTAISGPSPYAACGAGAAPGTTVSPNAEVEPFVAVNPTTVGMKSANFIAVWQQDAWSNGGARGSVAAASLDGGKTWAETTLPFTACAPNPVLDPATGQPFDRAADSWVSVGPDGIAYTTATAGSVGNLDNGVVAASSGDGGRTWANAALVKVDTFTSAGATRFFNDKDAVTADPTRPKTAYLVWDRLESPQGFPLFTHALAFTGPTWFAMTSDGGQHWSAPKIIVPTGQNNQTLGNQIVIAPDGTLYDFFDLILTTGPNSTGAMSIKQHGTNVAFVKSADGGATWSAPQIIAELQSVGVTDPNTGAPVTSGDDANVAPAVDPSTGALYVVWQDARFSGGQYDEVAIAVSTDGGAHWTAPARVNTPSGRPAFTPAVKVATDGTVGVSYYDFRTLADGNTTTLPTTYWLKKAPRGGAAFGADIAIVPANQPFNLLAAPFVRGGYFLGDYQGLVSVGTTFVTAFVQSNCADNSCAGGPNPTDVFTASFS